MKPIYIYSLSLMTDKLIYTYDKETIYGISNTDDISQRIDINYNDTTFCRRIQYLYSNYLNYIKQTGDSLARIGNELRCIRDVAVTQSF